MAQAAPVSGPIKALIEQLGHGMAGQGQLPTPAAIYAQLIRIRDEAELLEARASARDAKVHELLAELATTANRIGRLEGVALPAVTTIAALAARRAGAAQAGKEAKP